VPYRNGNKVWNATEWTDEMIDYLKENFNHKTNKELADHLNVRLTVLRNKTRELGLKKYEIEYWTDDMIRFLEENYKTMGDVEIKEVFEKRWPKKKGWKRGAIRKKRRQMGLERTGEEVEAILSRHHQRGGRMFTIEKNSSSLNMHDTWIAGLIAWRNPQLRDDILKNKPEIIELKRQLIILKRSINERKQKSEKDS
jgi:hypothetical protein